MPTPLFNPHALTLDASRRWVGYAALVRGLGLSVPVAAECAVANGHIRGSVRAEAGVRIFDQRYRPTDDITGHLQFALKHEMLDLLVLSRVFRHVGTEAVTAIVGANPARQHARQLWFLYEWLTPASDCRCPTWPAVAITFRCWTPRSISSASPRTGCAAPATRFSATRENGV